jgi:hypothetical protein
MYIDIEINKVGAGLVPALYKAIVPISKKGQARFAAPTTIISK